MEGYHDLNSNFGITVMLSREVTMTEFKKMLFIFGAIVSILLLVSACTSSESKAVGELIKTTSSAVPEAESVTRILEIVNTLERASEMDQTEQCRAASRLYCQMFQMVRDGCNDAGTTSFCQEVANVFYGGNFPTLGMRVCREVASDKCNELIGQEQRLQRLCLDLIAQCR